MAIQVTGIQDREAAQSDLSIQAIGLDEALHAKIEGHKAAITAAVGDDVSHVIFIPYPYGESDVMVNYDAQGNPMEPKLMALIQNGRGEDLTQNAELQDVLKDALGGELVEVRHAGQYGKATLSEALMHGRLDAEGAMQLRGALSDAGVDMRRVKQGSDERIR